MDLSTNSLGWHRTRRWLDMEIEDCTNFPLDEVNEFGRGFNTGRHPRGEFGTGTDSTGDVRMSETYNIPRPIFTPELEGDSMRWVANFSESLWSLEEEILTTTVVDILRYKGWTVIPPREGECTNVVE